MKLLNADYLNLHQRLGQRVSNLETGVHPTNSGLEWYDSVDWTLVNTEPGWPHATSGIYNFFWYWRKRVGIAHMRGGVTGNFGSVGSGGTKIGEIPSGVAPVNATELQVLIPQQAPWRTRATLTPGGDIILYNMTGASGSPYLCFDNAIWTPD